MPSKRSSRPLTAKATDAANRAARKLAGTTLARRAASTLKTEPVPARLDDWLVPLFGEELDRIEAAVESSGPEGYREFRGLDDDLWAMLLTLDYDAYPGIRDFLPDVPEPALQAMYNGASGPTLAAQSVCFYRKLKEMQAEYGSKDISQSSVLDFGCGWGRLTRMLAKDLEPGLLHGCDPAESILEVSRRSGVPAKLELSEFLPESLPFEEKFDLVFSFSVFTHISEKAATRSLEAIHGSLNEGGLFVLTIRPPSYIDFNPLMRPAVDRLGPDRLKVLRDPHYVFVPHETEGHPQFGGEEMHYGEAVVTLPYVKDNWTELFDLLDVSILAGDMYQIALSLSKK